MSSAWSLGRAVGVLTSLALFAACGPGPSKPNVLLITIDTLRADRLGSYGHAGADTPHLDRLAREGARFTQASAQVPLTLPSHASLLTGRDPLSHGVRDNTSFRLPESELTLAEILRTNGYATAATIGAVVLNGRFGLDQGFSHYDDLVVRADQAPDRLQRRADEVTARALGWLERHEEGAFFLWLHYFDPHEPYVPPARFRSSARSPYDREVAYVDRAIGDLLAGLQAVELASETLVVVTSDHGEGLQDHGEKTHGFLVYESTLRVPLILWAPGLVPAGRTIADPVRGIDVIPTILDYLDLPPKGDAQGVSLRPLMEQDARSLALASYAESLAGTLALGFSPVRSLRMGSWKYILAPEDELYHLDEDPGELRNLASTRREQVEIMRGRLLGRIEAARSSGPNPRIRLDEQEEQRLRRLGYLIGSAPLDETAWLDANPEPSGVDPKHAMEVIDHLVAGENLRTFRNWRAAEQHFTAVLRRYPENQHALTHLANLYADQGRLDDAIGILEPISSELSIPRAHQVLGKLYLRKERFTDALRVFQRLVTREPHNAWAYYYAAQAHRHLGQRDEERRALERAVSSEPSFSDARAELAQLLLEDGAVEQAVIAYEAALSQTPTSVSIREGLALAHLRRGDVERAADVARPLQRHREAEWTLRLVIAARAARLADPEYARSELRKLLEEDEGSIDVRYFLAVAQARTGEHEQALVSLGRALKGAGGIYGLVAAREKAFASLARDPSFQALVASEAER